MSVTPYPVQCYRDGEWTIVQTDQLYPGDLVSISTVPFTLNHCTLYEFLPTARQQNETTVSADILLVHGMCIVNEAMLSGESTPLLKESIQLLESSDPLDVDGAHKNAVLFSGTKILQAGMTGGFLS
jgi:manganese-transporting P-type ATPase